MQRNGLCASHFILSFLHFWPSAIFKRARCKLIQFDLTFAFIKFASSFLAHHGASATLHPFWTPWGHCHALILFGAPWVYCRALIVDPFWRTIGLLPHTHCRSFLVHYWAAAMRSSFLAHHESTATRSSSILFGAPWGCCHALILAREQKKEKKNR